MTESGEFTTAQDLKQCIEELQSLVINNLNTEIADKLLSSVNILRDSYTGKS